MLLIKGINHHKSFTHVSLFSVHIKGLAELQVQCLKNILPPVPTAYLRVSYSRTMSTALESWNICNLGSTICCYSSTVFSVILSTQTIQILNSLFSYSGFSFPFFLCEGVCCFDFIFLYHLHYPPIPIFVRILKNTEFSWPLRNKFTYSFP